MPLRNKISWIGLLSLVLVIPPTLVSKQAQEKQSPRSTSKPDQQDTIRIFTEEVILPVLTYDNFGHFDPTVTPDDLLVLEDGIPQKVTSVRRVPVNVVLLIDMGSVLVFTQHLDITRLIGRRVLSHLHAGDQIALIQFTSRAEVLQNWTDDIGKIARMLDPEKGRLLTGHRSSLQEGISTTTQIFDGREPGSMHLILMTDGDDRPGSAYATALSQLVRYQPTVEVLSYTTLASQEVAKRTNRFSFDREMKRFYRDYEETLRSSEVRLTAFAESFGGRIFLPSSQEQALKQGDEISGDIGARCVVTYIPKRPIGSNENSKPRHIEIFPRRTGLQLRALRSRVVSIPGAP